MPWTRQQVKYLLSKGSPLSGGQKSKMQGELHSNPAMGHMKKGFHKEGHTSEAMPTKEVFRHPYKSSSSPQAPLTCTHCGMPRGHEFHHSPMPGLKVG